MESLFERMGVTYHWEGDVRIPDLVLSDTTDYMVDKSRSKKNGGSGLGLALVKQIADAHGARLEVNSAPGKGTSVRVVL